MAGRADTAARASRHEPALDGVRGASFLAVFFGHANLIVDSGAATMAMFAFFALSGLLITTSLVGDRARNGRFVLRRFFARRALRLLPALACFLAAWLAVVVLFGHAPWMTSVPGSASGGAEPLTVALEAVGAAIGYLTNWTTIFSLSTGYSAIGHLWSLAVEEQFYLVWAPLLLLALCRGRRLAIVVAAALAAASIAEIPHIYDGGRGALRLEMGTDTRASAFLLGAIVALYWLGRPATGGATASRSARSAASLVGAIALVVLCASAVPLARSGPDHAWAFVADTFAAPLLLVALLVAPQHGIGRLFQGRILSYLGRRSYALYLWHYVWLTWFHGLGWVGVPLAFAASLGCAVGSWRFVEAPALALKCRFGADDGERSAGAQRTTGPLPELSAAGAPLG